MRTKQKSPGATVQQHYGGGAPPIMDENLIKMRKSCERIAAVLGLKDGARGVAAGVTTF